MVQGIGSASTFSPANGGGRGSSTVGLEAQLDRCNRQLADWTGCASAKTPEGKKIIQTLEDKVREIGSRIAETNDAKPRNAPALSQAKAGDTVPAITAPTNSYATVGSLVDVFA